MQPYFFPYFGYFQLIHASEVFVVYDDTQLISRGWVNRNKILVNGEASYITLPLKKAPLQTEIRFRELVDDIDWHKKKLLKAVRLSYSRARCYDATYPLIESIINFPERNLAVFNENLIKKMCNHLEIMTEILVSSKLGFGDGLSGNDRVISILKNLGSTHAINPIGGMDLYSCDEFMKHEIILKFIKMDAFRYKQFGEKFVNNLSIIDVLMFLDVAEVKALLQKYTLIDNFSETAWRTNRVE